MNLFYLAKPMYGGWISFTSHLALKYNYPLYRITKRTEKTQRHLGYDVFYTNICSNDISKYNNILITAIDKNYYKYLEFFPDNTSIVIHDPTEVKCNSSKSLIEHLPRFNIITIRKTVQEYLKNKYNLDSTFKVHPFYRYHITDSNKRYNYNISSISRIDYDKNTELLLKANRLLKHNNLQTIDIYGKKNDMYVYRNLKELDSMDENDPDSNYKGTFKKDFNTLDSILNNVSYIIDLSSINYDGGGSQYTFLEALHHNCVLILNKKWIDNKDTPFKHNYNCIVVDNENDILDFVKNIKKYDYNKLLNNSKLLLTEHINAVW